VYTAAVLDTQPPVCIVAVYVPSRDRSVTKVDRKQRFLESLLAGLGTLPVTERTGLLVGGDYNVISRTHQPVHRGFLPFELDFLESLEASGLVDTHAQCRPGVQAHSWIGRTGDGYRYDYFHIAGALADRVSDCTYLHCTRDERLSDHAALTLTLQVEAARLATSVPASNSAEMTLF
jgi:exodeoxyribonuclease-3